MTLPHLDRRAFLLGAAVLLAGTGRTFAATPRRIVSAGSDITETVVSLAGIETLQGVDTTSRTPAAVRALPSIGYLRQISVEGILSLEPDLLIANADLGPPAAVEQLRGAGLRVELIGADYSASGMAEKIRRVGALLGAETGAGALAEKVSATMANLAKHLEGLTKPPRLALVRSLDGGRPIVAGKIRSVDAAFVLAGAQNAFPDFALFKPVSQEAFAASPPDFIIADAATIAGAGGPAAFATTLGLPAGGADRIVAVEATTLFAFGPSGAAAIEDLARRLHPERFATP